MAFLLTKRVCCSNRTPVPRFGSPAFRLFGAVLWNPFGLVATVFPEFIAQRPRSARTRAVKEASAGLVRPAGSRGHGPARLDGTRERATVAGKVMKSGRRLDKTAALCADRTASRRWARSWKPGCRRPPSGARERWKPEGGETPQAARCSTTARPAMFLGRGRACSRGRWIFCGGQTAFAALVLPIRAQPVRLHRGAKHRAAGDSHRAFPGGKRSAQPPRREEAGSGRKGAPPRSDAPKAARRDQLAAGAVIDCNCSITPGSTNTQACSSAIGTLNTCANTVRRRWADRRAVPARASCGHQPASRCAADRIRPTRRSHRRTASDARGTGPSRSPCGAPCSRAGACPAGWRRYRACRRPRQTCCSRETCDLSFMTISGCTGELPGAVALTAQRSSQGSKTAAEDASAQGARLRRENAVIR